MRAIPIILLTSLAACGAQPRTATVPGAALAADTIAVASALCGTADPMPVHRAPGAAAPMPNARADAATSIPNACATTGARLVWRADSTAAAPDPADPPR